MTNTREIKFNWNWNNKLYCNFFSTIRFGVNSYVEGDLYNILLRESNVFINTGTSKLIHLYPDQLFINLYTILEIDTGYNFDESIKLFTKFNNNIVIDNTTLCHFLIFERTTKITLKK